MIKVYLDFNDSFLGEIKIRKNSTQLTKIQKIKEYLNEHYNANITRLLPTGRIDFATGESNIKYVMFGELGLLKGSRTIYFVES